MELEAQKVAEESDGYEQATAMYDSMCGMVLMLNYLYYPRVPPKYITWQIYMLMIISDACQI